MREPLVFLGHPGHELRILAWLGKHQPPVWVMTDGSGSSGKPRTELSRKILRKIDCPEGSMFGRFTDGEVHEALLRKDIKFFTEIVDELVATIRSDEHDAVVCDGVEGYNPSHDLVNMMAIAAA